MVSKSLAFISLLLCAILAQTVEVEALKFNFFKLKNEEDSGTLYSEDSDEDADESESEDEEDPIYPSLSCLLFGDIGCRTGCSIAGVVFGYKESTGVCRSQCSITVSTFGIQKTPRDCDQEDNLCYCKLPLEDLTSLWNDQFDSEDILQQIKNDKDLANEVQNILEDPFQTWPEAKENLKPVLTDDQYNKLKLNANNAAAKMMKDGKPDSAAIKKLVSEKLPATLKSADNKTLSALNLNKVLLEALDEAKYNSDEKDNESFNELVMDIRRTRNKTLDDILTEYQNETQFEEPAEDEDEPSLFESVINYVIDELVKTKEAKSKINGDNDNNGDTLSENALKKDRFVLENFDTNVFKRSGPINQKWKRKEYEVHYVRSKGGDITVVWIKGSDKVKLHKSSGSDVFQNWEFGNVYITISKSAGGASNQTWNFGKFSYHSSRKTGGYTNSNWSYNKPNEEMLKMYQGFIDQWCRDNVFLIQRAYCVIYDM